MKLPWVYNDYNVYLMLLFLRRVVVCGVNTQDMGFIFFASPSLSTTPSPHRRPKGRAEGARQNRQLPNAQRATEN